MTIVHQTYDKKSVSLHIVHRCVRYFVRQVQYLPDINAPTNIYTHE